MHRQQPLLLDLINILRNALHLHPQVCRRRPDLRVLAQHADAEPDALPQVVVVVRHERERPLAQVDRRGERHHVGEEVRVGEQRHAVSDQLAQLVGRPDRVFGVRVEGVARHGGRGGRARVDVAR